MDLDFLLPAATFLLVSAFIMVLKRRNETGAAPGAWSFPRFVSMMVPGAAAALMVWVIYSVVIPLFLPQDFPRSDAEPTAPAWAGIAYFSAMILGMAAHAAFEAVGKRKPYTAPVFDPWSFVQPALVAPIIFLGVRGILPQSDFTLEAILLSFQNGFFWQTVFDMVKKRPRAD
jgi:hypothetical protein